MMKKRFYELPITELKKMSKRYRMLFYFYVVGAILISIINGFVGAGSLMNVMTIQDSSLVPLLTLTLLAVNTFLVMFLWMVTESSYYKMIEQNIDIIIYLKTKMGD